MPAPIDAALDHVRRKGGVVLTPDGDVPEYVQRLTADGGDTATRPVLVWDATDGFWAAAGDVPGLPTEVGLVEALLFAKEYRGAAVFLFNCTGVDLGESADRVRRAVKVMAVALAAQNGAAVLLLGGPLPTALENAAPWVGEKPKAASGTTKAPKPAGVVAELAAVGDVEKFDTDEWREKITQLTPAQVNEIVQARAYAESLRRLNELRAALKLRFSRKDAVIDAVCTAAVAQVPIVLIGPPGTAKGNVIRAFCEGMGLGGQAGAEGADAKRYFEYLLTRYTTPEEIFGPVHIQDLIDRQTHRRVTTGHLPEAHVAFLDEIFKASSAILNTLLTILNERVFYNAGRPIPVPLIAIFAASNEVPSDPTLAALYDRFPLRIDCGPVPDDDLPDLLSRAWEQSFDRLFAGKAKAARLACANDLRLLHRVMFARYGGRAPADAARAGTGDFAAEFVRALRTLRVECAISDRTTPQLLAFARAQALLADKDRLTVDELDVFRHSRWDETGEHERMVANLKRSYRL